LAISSGLAYKLKPHVGNEGLMSSSVAGRMSEVSRSAPLITALFFIGPLVTVASPRTSPFFLMVIGVTLIVAALRRGVDWHALLRPNAALFALLILALYTCLSAAWAANPEGALSKSSLLGAATLVVFAGSAAITTLDAEEAQRASRALIAGALCGAGFLLIEILSDGALTRFAMNTIAAFRPDRAKHITIVDGRVTRINLSEFNQSAATLALLLWPGLLALRSAVEMPRRFLLALLFFLALAVPIAISEHDSSQVGIVASLTVLLVALKWPRATIRGLAAMWCLGFVLVLPLDFLAYNSGLHQVKWLPSSFRARVIIWEYTAERVLEQPWIGIGGDSTPAMKTKDGTPDWPKGFVYKRTTGQHAHNLFLQAWYELGVIGAILAALAGAAVALRLLALPAAAQAYGAASFTLFAVIAAFAWGMWQVWLMCAFALLPLYLGMAAQPFRASPDDAGAEAGDPASR
jgi:O-antigen ligase